jgi:glutamate--cysteine ligase
VRETEDGPVLGLRRGKASITLEPGVQFELSGEPLDDLHLIAAESDQHLLEVAPIADKMGIAWLATGFHPLSTGAELSWVPKQRYPIMREYLPRMGAAGLDMMQRTATVQGNFDYRSERDALLKMVVALKVSPLMQAWFSNGPFKEGKPSELLSSRGEVWRHMDPSRSGLLPQLWEKEDPTYDDYVDWTLDSGMFLFRRDGAVVKNTGQTFRAFMGQGFMRHSATVDDYKLHLTTLFPEVRLKNTLEVRSVDSLPPVLALASLAVWTGVFYDDQALAEARELVAPLEYEEVQAGRARMIAEGLHAPFCGRDGFEFAERLCEIAEGGLSRRNRRSEAGLTEEVFLGPASEILESRILPAERALERYRQTGSVVQATEVPRP